MIALLEGIIPHVKALHIAALALWCAGLFALPLMLARHEPADSQVEYARIRRVTHYGYVFVVTPVAVIAIISGTWLLFLRDAFIPWMFAKLVFVAMLVTFHAWVGYVLVAVAETEGNHQAPAPLIPLLLLVVPILAILSLVLAKPDLAFVGMPDWLVQPRGGHFPFDVPSR